MEPHPAAAPDHEWAQALFAEHRPALLRYACSLAHDPEVAADAVQETFLRLCRESRAKLEPRIPAWLFTVCRSRVFDHLRRHQRMNPLEEPTAAQLSASDPSPAAAAESSDTTARVFALIATLPPAHQEVLRLKFQAGLSYQEIAETTQKTVNHVGVLLHQALQRLREQVRSQTDLLPSPR
ncbi:MAG: sigma-70 family RNA polymerase sigma factor [Verrucomicrobiota bacterium JB022]|nr:sigma-70 family RNA polymerase sigma factor [Verrucomicrobiota bacterium JB022]